jgi:AraC-like DNA-binding protein
MLLAQRATLNAITAPELVATAARLVRIATLENSLGRAKSDVRVMLHMRIRDFVDRNLQNPELSIATVADSLNCSKRYIHRVFSASGETIGQYILRARLEQCQRFLQQPAMAHLSVTQIAFWWGFNNLAHFSRVFRRQFGMPPTECRKAVPASPYAAA